MEEWQDHENKIPKEMINSFRKMLTKKLILEKDNLVRAYQKNFVGT